jgi:hypothetical protein
MHMIGNTKKTFATLLIVVAGVLAAGAASAQDKAATADKTPGTGPSPYTDCGIGAALFKETDWAAISSNVIWDLGSTALTSATMSPETCSKQKVKVATHNHNWQRKLLWAKASI